MASSGESGFYIFWLVQLQSVFYQLSCSTEIMTLSLVLPLILLLLSTVGLFLSLWILIPAPNRSLLPLGVIASEVSPWLIGINGIIILLTVSLVSFGWLFCLILIGSFLGLGINTLPLIQFPRTNQQFATQMEKNLGQDYLQKVATGTHTLMRPSPLILIDVFRGITPQTVRIEREVQFASPDDTPLTLNTYRPLKVGKYPTVITIYGGAWRQGNPSNNESFSCYLASQGYSVIAIDYRHAPKYQFPAQLEDVQTALSYIQNHADILEVDPDRIAIMGRSAGGHLAMLAAYSLDIIPFRAVVNYYSPVNLTNGYYDLPFPDPIDVRAVLRNFLGGTPDELPELYHQASPRNYIRPNLPPSLLIYAGRDHVVKAKFGKKLETELQAQGNMAIFLEIPWAEHAFDAIFSGVSNQLALYYTERFLAWALRDS